MGVFHPIFAAVDFIHCNCNDSDIMGCCQRLDFATVNAFMASVDHFPGVKYPPVCIIKVSIPTRKR